MTTNKLNTQQKIIVAAEEHGWTYEGSFFHAVLRKGLRVIRVNFSVRGGITYASAESRCLYGANRLAQVLEVVGVDAR